MGTPGPGVIKGHRNCWYGMVGRFAQCSSRRMRVTSPSDYLNLRPSSNYMSVISETSYLGNSSQLCSTLWRGVQRYAGGALVELKRASRTYVWSEATL